MLLTMKESFFYTDKRVTELSVDLLLRLRTEPSSKWSTEIKISSEDAPGAFVHDPRIYYVKYRDGTLFRIGGEYLFVG